MISHLFQCHTHDGGVRARRYISGLLCTAARKNMERMSEAIPKANSQQLQQFLSSSPWEVGPVWSWVALEAARVMGGGPDAMLMIDESGFSKKGRHSVGVARQYNGRLGKVDNCQVGVFSALSVGSRTSLIGSRLYLPKEWTEDAKRCKKAGIPKERQKYKTKNELAWELIEEAVETGVEFDWVGMDAGYGRDQSLLLKISGLGKFYVADVDCSQQVWADEPPGSTRPRAVANSGARRVDAIWKEHQSEAREIELRDGENGPVRVRFWRRRVWIWPKTGEIPVEVWLLVSVRSDGGVKYSLSNAENDIPFEELGKRQGQRHFVEVCFKDGKNYLGMGEYEGRGWTFWHHHMALVGVAMLFTVTERVGYKRSMPLLSVRDLVEVIGGWFASFLTAEDRERIVLKRHRRRRREMKSKRRRARAKIAKSNLTK